MYEGIRNAQDRMFEKRWGVFNHYVCYPGRKPEAYPGWDLSDWNRTVENYDVENVARQLYDMGAGYYYITMIHGEDYMIAPNATYEAICGTKPGDLGSKRDLVLDLYEALKRYDIDLCLYFNCLTPCMKGFRKQYREQFGFLGDNCDERNAVPRGGNEKFVVKWASVLEEFSVRYGDKVKAWWFDSCYRNSGYTNDLLWPYYKAVKKGNPNALTAFNNGVIDQNAPMKRYFSEEEYTCGESEDFTYIPQDRFTEDGAQTHLLMPLGLDSPVLGCTWGGHGCCVGHAHMKDYVKRVNEAGGILTVDIHVAPDGTFDADQVEVLNGI